ncbi:AAA family ATPase, partial [Patescibacteria group bacterium]|nr:AAA family ATPase [Patescibacteria group bacterium]
MRINKIKLVNQTELEFGDINIFIGPNNVGKTTLLREIRSAPMNTNFLGGKWLSGENIHVLEFVESDFDDIENNLVFESNGQKLIRFYRNDNGVIDELKTDVLNDELKKCIEKKEFGVDRQNYGWYKRIIQNFIANEATEERLNVLGEVIVSKRSCPKDNYNYLLNRPDLISDLNSLLLKLFDCELVVDISERSVMELFITKNNPFCKNVIEHDDDLDKLLDCKHKHFIRLDVCGDGIKAVMRLFLSMYDPLTKMLFIDEPEVFLNKRIRKRVAEEFALLSKKSGKQIFLITHDPVFLSGFVAGHYSTNEIKVFYLKDFNNIRHIDFGNKKITQSTKQEKYLDMFFHKYSVICEGVDDVYIYSEYLRRKQLLDDVYFVGVDGVQIDDVVELAKNIIEGFNRDYPCREN